MAWHKDPDMPPPTVRTIFGNIFVDVVVLVNAIVVGYEVDANGDHEEIFIWVRFGIALFYFIEIDLKLVYYGRPFIRVPMNVADLILIYVVFFAALPRGGLGAMNLKWLWRMSVLRILRILRVWKLASDLPWLADLWLVLVGLARAFKGLLWLALMLLVIIAATSCAAAGMIRAVNAEQVSCAPEAVEAGDCMIVEHYFGSIWNSALTIFQLITLDGWAAKVVRPLFGADYILLAAALSVFSTVMASGVVSVAIGVMVWSTVELARNHQHHASQIQIEGDKRIIGVLRRYFDKVLALEGHTVIDAREFEDSSSVPQVRRALDKLNLPVTGTEELFNHLDTENVGHLTAAQLQKGLEKLTQPATRFDIACLTATIGGSVTYTGRITKRADGVIDSLEEMRHLMSQSFAELNKMTHNDVPEVALRKKGIIYNPVPPGPTRYTR